MHTVRALLLAIALAATACSSDSETAIGAESPTTTEVTTTEAPSAPASALVAEPVVEAVAEPVEAQPASAESDPAEVGDEADPAIVADLTAYIVAYYTGDTEVAWNTASDRCQDLMGKEFHDATVVQYTSLAPGAIVSDISTLVNGDRALVTYNVLYADGGLFDAFDSQLWLFADGNWHQNAC